MNNLDWRLPSPIAQENFRRLAKLWEEHRTDAEGIIDEALFEDSDKYVVHDERIPSERGRAEIGMSMPVREQIRFWPEALHYFGHGYACMPFAATFYANMHYRASESAFQDLPAERVSAAIVSDHDGGQLDITEGAVLHMHGLAVLNFYSDDIRDQLEREDLADEKLLRLKGTIDPGIGAVESVKLVRLCEPIKPQEDTDNPDAGE